MPTEEVEQTQEQSGEEWNYGHVAIRDAGGVQVGNAAVGYRTMRQWIPPDAGCASWTYDPIPEPAELMSYGNQKGIPRGVVARYDLKGHRLWYHALLDGLCYGIETDAEGSILVVGGGAANSTFPDMPAVTMHFNGSEVISSGYPCPPPGTAVRTKPYIAKYDQDGNLLWLEMFGIDASLADCWSFRGEFYDVTPITYQGDIAYMAVGYCCSSNDPMPQAFVVRVRKDGTLIDKHAYGPADPIWSGFGTNAFFPAPNDPEVSAQLRFTAVATHPDLNQVSLTGFFRKANTAQAGIQPLMNVFMLTLDQNSATPYAPGAGQFISTYDEQAELFTEGTYLTGHVHSTTGVNYVKKNGNVRLIWPVLANFPLQADCPANDYFAGKSIAYLKVHGFSADGTDLLWTSDLGEVRAYDLQSDICATAEGDIAVISSKWSQPYVHGGPQFGWNQLTQVQRDCLEDRFSYDVNGSSYGGFIDWDREVDPDPEGTPPEPIYSYWNTDAFVAKLAFETGEMRWCTQWDTDPTAAPACWPGDLKKQECMYKISVDDDGGLVVSGNTSNNFDDYYLAKLFPDCQSREDYDPVIAAAVMASPDRSYTVGVNESWTTDKKIHGTIVIPDGHQLNIGSGAVIRFADSRLLAHPTRIIVEAGGRLTVGGNAVLTSLPGCNGQNAMWDGIILRGIPGYPQEPLATTDQGFARLRDCTIEHARTAISVAEIMLTNESMAIAEQNASGGIVIADNAIFRNNIRDVFFSPFENHQGDYPNGLYGIEENKSRFRTCTFANTAQLNDPYQRPQAHATLFGVRGVRFQGCTFTGGVYPMLDAFDNTVLTDQYMGQGIKSIMSTFAVEARCQPQQYGDPCTEEELVRNTFNTLWYGVNASTFGDMSRTFIVDRSDFRGCVKGIRMEGIQDAGITLNTFEVGDLPVGDLAVTPYGVYSDQCTGYEIEENRFGIGAHAAPERKVGLVIKDSGKYPNTYYNNRFDGLFSGTIIEGQNSSEDFTSGLAIKCNDYGNEAVCEFDVALTGEAPTIAEQQGAIFNEQSPAGNTFSWSCGSSENDIWVEPSTMHYFEYVHHLQGMDPADPHVEPLCYSQPQIDPFQIIEATGWSYDKSIACPSTRSRERERSMSKQSAAQANDELADAQATYEATKDNGDTEGLQALVESSTSSLAIRDALLAAAPKVGVETFQAAFDRLNAPLTHWHLTQAIVANSPVQAEVLKLAYNSALEGFYLTLIEQAQTGEVNILSILEAEQSAKAHDKGEELGDLGRNSQLDSLDIDGTLDSLKLFHEDLDAPNNALTILGVSAAKGEWTEAQVLAASLEQTSDEPALYGTVKRWAAAQGYGGWYALDMDTRTWLQALAADRDAQGSAQAQAWLCALGEPEQPEIILLPSLTRSASATSRARVRSAGAEPILVLFPNPANDGVHVAYQLPEDLPMARLSLLDVSGRELWGTRSGGGIQLVDVSLESAPAGLYLCRLEVEGSALATERLIVAR